MLTFSAGDSSRMVDVAILDDAHDDGEEALTLALANVSARVLADAEACLRDSGARRPCTWSSSVSTRRAPGFDARFDGRWGSPRHEPRDGARPATGRNRNDVVRATGNEATTREMPATSARNKEMAAGCVQESTDGQDKAKRGGQPDRQRSRRSSRGDDGVRIQTVDKSAPESTSARSRSRQEPVYERKRSSVAVAGQPLAVASMSECVHLFLGHRTTPWRASRRTPAGGVELGGALLGRGRLASGGAAAGAPEMRCSVVSCGRDGRFSRPRPAPAARRTAARFENTRLWWNDITECLVNQKLGGELPLSTTVESDDPAAMLFCRDYDGANGLRATEKEVVDRIAMALSGRSVMMPTEEEAPALPLVGVGILGFLLAGRGAWLRRRA